MTVSLKPPALFKQLQQKAAGVSAAELSVSLVTNTKEQLVSQRMLNLRRVIASGQR